LLVRLFLAINLEAMTRQTVYDRAAQLRAAAPHFKWVSSDRLHLTLKFLGEQPDEAVPRLAAAMDDVSRRHRAIDTFLNEFGGFPNFRRLRVVFISMQPDPRLELLHHDVEGACRALGYGLDGRPFRPHVTLARVKHLMTAEAMRALRRESEGGRADAIETTVRSIDLMRSTLREAVPEYELLHASPLREA
jgi:2'-5' RNA ligase